MIWKPHVTVAAIIENQGRFLLVEERIEGKTVFNQPAGHLESGENLVDAVRREVLEETARPFRPQALVGVYLYDLPKKDRSYLRFCFCGSVDQPAPERHLDQEIIATHWLSPEQIRERHAQLRSPMVLKCLDDYLEGKRLPLDSLRHMRA